MLKKLWTKLGTIRVRILVIIALCWLLPTMVLGVYMSGLFFDALREKTEQALLAGATHAQEMTVQEIDRVLKKSKDVTYDEQLSNYAASYLSGESRYEDFYAASRIYWSRMFQRERTMDFTAFFLLEKPDLPIYTASHVDELLHFQQAVQPQILQIGETLDTGSLFTYIDGQLYHVRNLFNRKLERFGMLVLRIDPLYLLSSLLDPSSIWMGQADIVLDEYVYAANSDDPLDLGSFRAGLYDQEGDLYYSGEVLTGDYALHYRIRLDRSVVYGQVNEYYQIIVALILLLLPLEMLIMLFIHFSLTKPLMQLADATQRLAKGELGITVPVQGMDEISRVGMGFNAMSLRMQNLIDKSYREELALRDARISALQSRINPHFLNNALELMNWQARIEGADTVSQMIEAMSTLLNAGLDRTNERTVPLHQELEVADAYFFFIEQRFGGRLCIEKTIDPALRNFPVPRLIIQTLLENAVEHGIGPAGGGTIRLHVYQKDTYACIDVCNDGRRLTQAEREKINRLLSLSNREAQSEHLGIRNVNLRLKLIYHDQAGLTFDTDASDDTVAHIYIPMEEENIV